MKCFSWLAAIVLLLLSAPATAFAERPRTPIDEATTFAICEYVDDSGIVDELINSGVEVVMRGWFKWGSDPSDWSAIAAGVARLHDAGVPVIGGFTASSFFKYEDGTTDDQFNDFVTRDARGNVAILWGDNGAHYAPSNPAVVDYLLEHLRLQVEAGLDGFFIDEPQTIGSPAWNFGDEGYDDYAVAGFRDYLAQKYPDYTAPDWKQHFDIDDIATFNYRDYLAAHGWADQPLLSFLANPLFFEWEPLLQWADPTNIFVADPLVMYGDADFHGHETRQYLQRLIDGIHALSTEYGRPLYNCVNGISPFVDFQMMYLFAPYPLRWSFVDWFRQGRAASRTLLGRDAPLIYFLDWPTSMTWYSTLPVQQKIDYIRVNSAEAYASGVFYAFHFKNYLQDIRTNGTHDLVFHLIEWLENHADFYHGLTEHPRWREVDVPDRAIAHTLWYDPARKLALLHLINHHYPGTHIEPQTDVAATVPIGHVLSAKVISPDFDDEIPLVFQSTDDRTTLTVPNLEFYDVVVMEYEDVAPDDDTTGDDDAVDDDSIDDDSADDDAAADDDVSADDDNGGDDNAGCGC